MPASIFSVVDLPAPFGPMNATRSPGAIENDRPVDGHDRLRLRAKQIANASAQRPRRGGRRTRNDFETRSSSTAGCMANFSVSPRGSLRK